MTTRTAERVRTTAHPARPTAKAAVAKPAPVLEELSREAGERNHFAARMGDSIIAIARTTGPGAFQFTERVGIVQPAYCTALGKVMLAALRPEQFERYHERTKLRPFTPKTIADPQRLRTEIESTRATGLAFDEGEFEAELRCCSVPVRDLIGHVVGAIGISGPVRRLSIQTLQGRAKVVEQAAARLSAEFGAAGDKAGRQTG